MPNNKLYNDIYAISFKRLFRLEKEKIDKDAINKSVELALEFLNTNKENFKEFDRCSEDLFKAFQIKIGTSATLSNNDDHENWYNPNQKRPYWDTHKEWLLEHNKKPIDVVNEIDKSTAWQ